MIGIIISGHGDFPIGMLDSVRLIAGEVPKARAIPFKDNVEELEAALDAAMEELEGGYGVVCFTDLAGGTPFNACSRLAVKRGNVKVIGGANSPMILSGLFLRHLPLEEFVAQVMEEGKSNIQQFTLKKKEYVEDSEGI